ncbi:hypothetical protein HY994_03595 [Candidatus Micrarchaeota archaeon]|nr:hypothetical protein [Candidatus Micrarchaeota archaeon]
MDAPIELVIAIIIMVTSLGLGFYVMETSKNNQCISALQTQTQQLQQAILDVGLGSAGSKKTIRFSMPSCGDQAVQGIQFVKYTSAELCRRCPGHYSGCWQIVPVARTRDGMTAVSDAITCIELPAERVSIEQAQTPDQSCTPLSTTPCPDGTTSCLSQLGIGSSLYNPASGTGSSNWLTLGSQNARQYLITFNKVLSVGDVTGHTQITMCAVPVGVRTN